MMSCSLVVENMPGIVSGELAPALLAKCDRHIMQCSDCRDALRGARSLALLRGREVGELSSALFDRTVSKGLAVSSGPARYGGFWIGTGFGGAIAASILALSLALGWIDPAADLEPAAAQFTVALDEPRNMEIAIETDQALAGANISIMLSDGIELDGYGHRRELNWTTDLQAGVNRLSLPVLAVDPAGGQVVVRLRHPDSEQLFVVRLKTEA